MESQPTATLQPKRERMALLLASGWTMKAAAEDTKVGERTAHEWKSDPAFKARVAALRAEILERSVGIMASATSAAAAKLVELLKDDNPAIRLRAATAILDGAVKLRDHTELDARLLAIEQRQAEAK